VGFAHGPVLDVCIAPVNNGDVDEIKCT
jgi:hypothetical protein